MSNVSRQLPLTDMLHVPARSPLSWWMPAGRPDHAAHVGRRDQHREDVAQPPHQIVAEFPAVVVFDEAQQAPVPDAPNVHIGVYAYTVQMSSGAGVVLQKLYLLQGGHRLSPLANPSVHAKGERSGVSNCDEIYLDSVACILAYQSFDGGKLTRRKHQLLGALRHSAIYTAHATKRNCSGSDYSSRR